jgi:flagellar M-ring protein FliF
VDAIVHLVTSSVEGLAAENVTVVDTTGAILSRGDGQSGAAAALDHRRQIEQTLEESVTAILDRAVGVGRAVVTVAAEVDTSQVEKTAETFDPDATALRSEQSTEERGAGSAAGVGGTAGVRAALAGETGTPRAGGPTGSSRTTETKNYEVSRTTSRETVPSGKIQRLHVAVLLDEGGATPGQKGAAPAAPPIDDATVERLAGLVRRAVGFDPGRGDQVEIQKVRFAPTPDPGPLPEGPGVVSRAMPFAPHLLTAGGLLVLLVLASSLRRAPLVEPVLPPLPRTVREIENTLRAPAPAVTGAAPAPALLAARAAEDDHARAASVLRGWLGE